MADFFGTVQGNRGKATRLGHSSLNVTAQSYEGSVIIRMFKMADDTQCVDISVGSGSTSSGAFTLYTGPIKGLFDDRVNFRG